MSANLADQLYEANQEEAREELEIDELGLPLPKLKTTRALYEYLAARCLRRNPHLHTRPDGNLYNSHTLINPTVKDIARLADWTDSLSSQAASYIYDRLKEVSDTLNPDVIAITPTLGWDFSTQSFCTPPKGQKEFNVISDW